MGPDLEKAILEISLRMRLMRAVQEDSAGTDSLSERDVMILELLGDRGVMTVSQIAAMAPGASESTVSTTITKLWRDKKMVSKTISPQNQRTTNIELTAKGRETIESFNNLRAERFGALFGAMNVTDDEKGVLLRILARAIPILDEHLGFGDGIK